MYKIGDRVVVAGCGVGTIQDVEKMSMDGCSIEMYRIEFSMDDHVVWIPKGAEQAKGLRPPMTPENLEQTWQTLSSQEAPETRKNWNKRQRRYQQILVANCAHDTAALLGELAAIQRNKELSFSEKKVFDKLREILATEIAAVLGATLPDAEKLLDERLAA